LPKNISLLNKKNCNIFVVQVIITIWGNLGDITQPCYNRYKCTNRTGL
jgi:hypothetical protein